MRRELGTGRERVLVYAPRSPRPDLVLGTAFRPAVSHDGKLLVYGARDRGRTGLRLLNLETLEDRWLRYPVQQDELQASGWRDLLPRHVFSADDRALIANDGGRIVAGLICRAARRARYRSGCRRSCRSVPRRARACTRRPARAVTHHPDPGRLT